MVGFLETPWAVDAAGQDVPTRFTVHDNIVTQEVDLSDPYIQYPVVADPDMWSVIMTAAGCAVEIVGMVLVGAKAVQLLLKAERIVKAAKQAIKYFNALGGTVKKVIKLLKKYVKNKLSLTKKQVTALELLVKQVGKTFLTALGLGTCWAIVTSDY